MSERVLAIIKIGGQLDASKAERLIDDINNAEVFAHEGDVYFEPLTVDDLLAARTPEGHLYLCDDEAAWGDMPAIVACCREMGLPYRLWHESMSEFGSLISVWFPGMDHAASLTGDHCNPDSFLVEGTVVQRALTAIENDNIGEAVQELKAILPEVPALPPFEVIRDIAIPADAHVPPPA